MVTALHILAFPAVLTPAVAVIVLIAPHAAGYVRDCRRPEHLDTTRER